VTGPQSSAGAVDYEDTAQSGASRISESDVTQDPRTDLAPAMITLSSALPSGYGHPDDN
jgi:hypothetical protein